MSKIKALFLDKLESDPDFSAQVEMDQSMEPELPAPEPENPAHFDNDEIPF